VCKEFFASEISKKLDPICVKDPAGFAHEITILALFVVSVSVPEAE
jgi:hypothetical protein